MGGDMKLTLHPVDTRDHREAFMYFKVRVHPSLRNREFRDLRGYKIYARDRCLPCYGRGNLWITMEDPEYIYYAYTEADWEDLVERVMHINMVEQHNTVTREDIIWKEDE
jgi:hypothetical protein